MSERYRTIFLAGLLAVAVTRLAAGAPDLQGFDGRSYGYPSSYYRVVPSSAVAGQIITNYLYVANFGDTASGSFYVRVYLSKDASIDPATDYVLGTFSFGGLNPFSFQGGYVGLQLPAEDTITSLGGAGTFYIGMYVDCFNQVSESNEGNNRNQGDGQDRASLTISIPQPDLAGFDGRPTYTNAYFDVQDGTLNWGDDCQIHLAVQNLSGGNAGPFKTRVYLSTNSTIDTDTGYLLLTVNFSSGLKGLSYSWYDGSFTLPSVNPFGNNQSNFYIGMIVDADLEVVESNESNNQNLGNGIDLDTAVIVNPLPDLLATDSTSPYDDGIVAFGEVADDGRGNARGVQTVTLLNRGKAALTVSNLVLSGSADFRLVQIASSIQNFIQPSTLPRTIAKDGAESWVLTLEFDPTSTNSQSATLTVVSDDPDTPSLALSLTGTGRPVPDIALDIPEAVEIDFGNVVEDGPGGYTATRTVSLKNPGTGPLTVFQNGLLLLSGASFGIVSVTSSTQGAIDLAAGPRTIAPGGQEHWDVTIVFDPATRGPCSDGLRVLSDDPDEPEFVVSLRGRGAAPMQLVVTDSAGAPDDLNVPFADTHADGSELEFSTATVILRNAGEAPLTVASNGIAIATGVHFRVESIVSDVQGPLDLSAGPAVLAGSTAETWTVTVLFDPAEAGLLGDTLTIITDDLAAPVVNLMLTGQGLAQPALRVADSVPPEDDAAVGFGAVLNDGPGLRTAEETLTLKNVGTEPLVVARQGISVAGAPAFAVESVVSSTRGPVDLDSAEDSARTLAPTQAETWVITLVFDPATNGPHSATLEILCNDPQAPTTSVALAGSGVVPMIALLSPAEDLNVSAGLVFDVAWEDAYEAGDAQISLYVDTDLDPSSGLLPVAEGLSEDDAVDTYAWRVPESLEGGTYQLYATISDGDVTTGAYAPGKLTVDPLGAFKLRSPVEVTSPDYAYEFEYNGQVYEGVTHLQPGDNVVTVSCPKEGGGTATFQFTVRLVPSLVHAESVSYNEISLVKETKNGNGITTTFTYDPFGRLIRRASSNGATVDYEYDVLGRRVRMTDATGTTFYEWDDLDRLTAVITSANGVKGDADDRVVRYEYDLAGRRTALVYPDGERVEYSYDLAGRLVCLSNVTRGLAFTYQYSTNSGLLTKLSRPNGIETTYGYDNMARVTNLVHWRGGMRLAEFAYTLDAAGKATELRILGTQGVERVERYTYDRFDRLSEVVYSDDEIVDSNDTVVSFTYDGIGNRLSMTTRVAGVVAEVRRYIYGNENRLIRVTDGEGVTVAEYDYDAAGNMIQERTADHTRFFSYDERNLLVSVVDGSNYVTYAYNGDGHRVARTVNGQKTIFVLDDHRSVFETLQELDAMGVPRKTYLLAKRPLAVFGDEEAWFPLGDRLGSVRRVADGAGEIGPALAYDAFGVPEGSAAALDYGFAGEHRDPETGFIYLRARYYYPGLGRFLQKDPLGVAAGLNGYLYCAGDPVNRTDPLGMDDDTAFERFINGERDYDWVYVHGIQGDMEAARAAARSLGLNPDDPRGLVIAPYGVDDRPLGTVAQCLEVAGYAFGLFRPSGFSELAGKHIGTIYTFSGGGAAMRKAEIEYGFTYDRWVSSAAVTGPDGYTELFRHPTHGENLAGVAIDTVVGMVIPRAVTFGDNQTLVGAAFTIKSDTPVGAIGKLIKGTASAVGGAVGRLFKAINLFRTPEENTTEVGGVLIDKAAELVGENLSDLRGALYDPISGQFVLLGTDSAADIRDINLDYLYTGLQAVFGSAVPPYVTLEPPASAYTSWGDYGDGDGVFEPGEKGGFILRYNPIWPEVDTTVDVVLKAEWSGSNYTWTARFDCVPQNMYAGGRRAMKLVFNSWVSAPPTGVTLNTTPWQNHIWSECCFTLNADGQDFLGRFTLYNGSSNNFLVTDVRVIPARQHRRFGGRVEGSRLGWVMLEADRVMKCLAVGKDNLTGALYNSATVPVPGYSNMTERGGSGNIRMWFTPNDMTLKRHVDPETGRACIVFDRASVALNTESFMMGLPQPPEARAFADHFTSNYDAFAELEFPCVDPEDPAGTNIVYVKIFEQLREAMQAVALARFFRDNNIPVDMWWLNSWTPPAAFSPKTTPTAYNEENGVVIFGGVQVNRPNSYVPSTTAKSVADVVQASRPPQAGDPEADLREQVWTNDTAVGALRAIAAQMAPEPQDATLTLREVDLRFASPGEWPLEFVRFYNASWMGGMHMGPGWRCTPLVLEFERPSWFDEHGLMRDGTNTVWKDARKDTRLRSGAVRLVNLRTGRVLDFTSSLVLDYAVDNIGNVVITVSGLSSNGVPSFTPGLRQDGSTLTQVPGTYSYVLSSPDGSQVTFDHEGRLLELRDRCGQRKTYSYDALNRLTNIADSAGQQLVLAYDESGRVASVTGPAGEQVIYAYDGSGCLISATHVRSGATTTYQYNENRQCVKRVTFNGLTSLAAEADLKGRGQEWLDSRSNVLRCTFLQNEEGSMRTTEVIDPLVTDPTLQPVRRVFDRLGRLLAVQEPTGAQTTYGYESGSLLPNLVQLPVDGRAPVTIERDACGRPTRIHDPANRGAQDLLATYDPAGGWLTEFSDAAGRLTTFTYTTNGLPVRVRRSLHGQPVDLGFAYTESGALLAVTNPLGVRAFTIYRDALDRPTNLVDATGVAIRYEYDELGRLWKVWDPRRSGPVEYVYDNFDRVVEIRYPVGSVSNEYDPEKGWLIRRTDILGRTTRYVRDPVTGDILEVIEENPAGTDRVTRLEYNRFGQVTNIIPPDAPPISFQYDDLGRPLGVSETDAQPPGAPRALDSDCADDGIPTFATNHVFTWGAPHADSGIEGYSIGCDEVPDEVVDTEAASWVWTNVSPGEHTFQVRAKSRNGLWGPSASFRLVVRAMTEYDQWRVQHFTPEEADNDAISGPEADPDGDGFRNDHEYLADTDPKDPESVLKLLSAWPVPGGVRVEWKGGREAWQVLEARPRLDSAGGPWLPVFTNEPPTATQTSVVEPVGDVESRFYRLRATR